MNFIARTRNDMGRIRVLTLPGAAGNALCKVAAKPAHLVVGLLEPVLDKVGVILGHLFHVVGGIPVAVIRVVDVAQGGVCAPEQVKRIRPDKIVPVRRGGADFGVVQRRFVPQVVPVVPLRLAHLAGRV